MLRITALMDNKLSENQDLTAEHGLSLLADYHGCRILFDCGAGGSFLCNAEALELDLAQLDAVVLSHSHYDHATGFRPLTEAGLGSSTLFTGPHFFEPKVSRGPEDFADRSAGFDREFLAEHRICHREVALHKEIFPGVHLIGGFPRCSDYETIPQKFYRKTEAGYQNDDFADEICMALETDGALVVLVGCSHPGIVNMIRHVKGTLGLPVRAVFGGTHLVEADSDRLEHTIDDLQSLGLKILGLSHCSGDAVGQITASRKDIQSRYLGCGDSFTID